MSILAAGIGALGSIAGGVINAFSNQRAADKQYDYQKDLIERQNVYNSPANQMKRLQEAGLNPNLVYGGGNVTGNQSGTGSAPTVQSDGDFGIGAAAQNAINTTMAIDNHDMDMQMKHQEILHKKDNHDAILKQAEAQLEKTKTEDKVLKSQLLTNQMTNDILKHDVNIIKKKQFFFYWCLL